MIGGVLIFAGGLVVGLTLGGVIGWLAALSSEDGE